MKGPRPAPTTLRAGPRGPRSPAGGSPRRCLGRFPSPPPPHFLIGQSAGDFKRATKVATMLRKGYNLGDYQHGECVLMSTLRRSFTMLGALAMVACGGGGGPGPGPTPVITKTGG